MDEQIKVKQLDNQETSSVAREETGAEISKTESGAISNSTIPTTSFSKDVEKLGKILARIAARKASAA